MRTISDLSLATLAQQTGVEPINVIAINWNGTWQYYGDEAHPEYNIEGRVLELGALESVVNISGNTNTQSLNVRLSDQDGTLKLIFNQQDIHKRPVRIYQWFEGIPFSDAFVIFEGQIGSPIVWKEGERSLSFDVFTQVEDAEVGFSAEEGNFAYIPTNIIGEAWPLVFGTAAEVPAIRLIDPPSAVTQEPIGSLEVDNTNLEDANNRESAGLCREYALSCFLGAAIALGNAQLNYFLGRDSQISREEAEAYIQLADEQYDLGRRLEEQGNQYLNKMYEINRNNFKTAVDENNRPPEVEKNQLQIIGGQLYPQGVTVDITIGGVVFTGVFNGDVFTIFNRGNPFTPDDPIAGPTTITEDEVAYNYETELALQRFFYAVGGTATRISGSYPITYIASLLHTTILSVVGHRSINGVRVKLIVPPQYYTVQHLTFGSLTATFITFPIPLSLLTDQEGWEDDIFCNIQSPVGPNVVDVIQYLIDTYTTKEIDTTSFTTVKAYQNPFPVGFALTDRENVTKVLQEIAYQSRCALYTKQDVFYIKYLSREESPVATITESDIEFGTLEITCDDTENLITKYTALWKQRLSANKQNRIVYRYNVRKYGLHSETQTFYIYNIQTLVEKSALFWLIRRANTWKRVTFSTALNHLNLETYDTITLDLQNSLIANGPIPAIIDAALYDSGNQRVEITCWVPVRFGEMEQFPFYWPAAIGVEYIFPTEGDPYGGGSETYEEVEGELYDQAPVAGTNIQSTRRSYGRGNFAVTDNGAIAPTVDFILDNREIEQGTTPNNTGRTFRQYVVKPPIDQESGITQIDAPFPGYVVEQINGAFYYVDVYFNGLSKDPTRVRVLQLAIKDDDVIPAGTPTIVSRNYSSILDSRGNSRRVPQYTMQVPVWLPAIDEDDSDTLNGPDEQASYEDDVIQDATDNDVPGFDSDDTTGESEDE